MIKEGIISLTPEERNQVEDLIPDIIEAISGGYIGDNRQLEIGEIDALSADKTPIKVKIFVGNNLSLKHADGYYQTNDPKNPTDNLILIQQFHFAPYFKGLSGLDLKLTKIATGNENIGLEKLRKVLKHELIHAKDPAENQHYSNRGYKSDNAEVYYKSWTEFQTMTGQFFEAITTGVDRALRLGMSKDDILKALNNILQYYSGKTKIFNQEAKDFIQGSGKRNIFQSIINFFTKFKSAIEDYAEFLSMIKKYNPEGYKEFLTDLYKTIDQAKDRLKTLQEMQQINEVKRFQELAGILNEEANAEQAAEKGLEDFLGDIKSAASTIKPSPKDGQVKEGLITLFAIAAGAPGLLNLLGKGADLIGQYFSQGAVNSTKIGSALQKAGHKLEHKYIEGIAFLLKKAYPKDFGNEDPFDETSSLHDAAHGIYAAILAAAAVGSGMEAYNAVNLIIKGLEGGAAAFKSAEVAQLAQKIIAA